MMTPLDSPMTAQHLTHSIEAEQSILGALMVEQAAWDRCGHMLGESDFYARRHRLIFAAIKRLAEEGRPTDGLTIHTALEGDKEFLAEGGLPYLGELIKNMAGTANVEHYARIVVDRALYRRVFCGYMAAGDVLGDASIPVAERAQQAANKITDALDGANAADAPATMHESLTGWIGHLEQVVAAGGQILGIPTGFPDLDSAISGMSPGELIVLAARPSMGKSALALNICAHVAKAGMGVHVSSLEMPRNAVLSRLCACTTMASYGAIRHADFERMGQGLTAFASMARDWNMSISDNPSLTLEKLEYSLRYQRRRSGLHFAMVDYLQLMQVSSIENRNNAIAELSRGLKVLAGVLGIPILALSQLNRSLESRPNKRPVLSDLRDSGAIEQDAHTILFLYDDKVYNPETPNPEYTELIIGKARDSERGQVIPLIKRLDCMRFLSADRESLPMNWRGNQSEKPAGQGRPKYNLGGARGRGDD